MHPKTEAFVFVCILLNCMYDTTCPESTEEYDMNRIIMYMVFFI